VRATIPALIDIRIESKPWRTLAQESEPEQAHAPPEEGNGKKASWLSPDHSSHKWWVTLALMLGILTQGLNFGTLNVALPSMMTNLRADVETIQWWR